ncbi:phosphopantothenate--cysteine ligase [Streptococcus merionis]|uniref:phosphopantothenate--cysteine ligase n=1 Tax=Streptococcus merionis TaxID=400065 RepID=UPI0026F27AD7|nr:phosphopantothenate--cysteine ligase [Streptococcus merionis]
MKILITSGGTSERIDQVREITNQATGRLGQVMAEVFLAAGHEVTFVTTKHALKPLEHDRLTTHLVSNVASLLEALEQQVPAHDAIIHAMAVSDYSPIYMTDFDTVANSDDLTEFLHAQNSETKISSNANYQVLFLKKTPKIISMIKKWNPETILIGFKLLVDVDKSELFSVARNSLLKNQADLIVANDLTEISGDQHIAYLVDHKSEQRVTTKQEISLQLLNYLERKEHQS